MVRTQTYRAGQHDLARLTNNEDWKHWRVARSTITYQRYPSMLADIVNSCIKHYELFHTKTQTCFEGDSRHCRRTYVKTTLCRS